MEKLWEHLAGKTRLAESSLKIGGREYRIVRPASPEALLDEQDFEQDERLPYWAELWPSAIALARYIAGRDLTGKRVIELGCGVGVPSVVALEREADILATDYYEAALDFTAYNARENLERELRTSLLDWRTPELDSLGRFDLVLAADVLYERENARLLGDLVPELLAPGGETVIADPQRKNASRFLEAMAEQGFQRSTTTLPVEQGGERIDVLLHRFSV